MSSIVSDMENLMEIFVKVSNSTNIIPRYLWSDGEKPDDFFEKKPFY